MYQYVTGLPFGLLELHVYDYNYIYVWHCFFLQSERLQILQALSRSLTLAQDTNLAGISDMCEHFTGADFKALLYNAQLVAIHRNTNANQLYKEVSSSAKTSKGDEMPKDSSTAAVSDEAEENILYIPSLAEGTKHVSAEELTRLHSEVRSDWSRLLG